MFATPRPAVASHAGPQEPLPHLWGLILAGGDGQRLQPLIKAWYGHAPQTVLHIFRRPFAPPADPRTRGAPDSCGAPTDRRDTGPYDLCAKNCATAPQRPSSSSRVTVRQGRGFCYLCSILSTAIRRPSWRSSPQTTLSVKTRFMAAVATAVASLATHPRHLVLLGMAPEGPESMAGLRGATSWSRLVGKWCIGCSSFGKSPRRAWLRACIAVRHCGIPWSW